jgi:hypothetical protein
MALNDFYEAIKLDAADKATLLRKRGFMPGLSVALGYKSSRAENREILQGLGDRYEPQVLIKAGLWSQSPEGPRPSAKYCGLGIVGKKAKAKKKLDEDEERDPDEGEMEWGWINPILIPYFNEQGEVAQLRPHKDYVKGRGVHLYVARSPRLEKVKEEGRAGRRDGGGCGRPDERLNGPPKVQELAVITEGEFKAGALFQVFRDEIGIGAIPGISTAKKESIQNEIKHWLAVIGAKRVVVAFDNEEKGDPNLASYKEDAWKRYDTEAWARYLAGWLGKEGYEATVAWLPKEWRDAKGKADWDGVLAARVREGMKEIPIEDEAERGRRAWAQCRGAVRKDFRAVLESGGDPDDQEKQPGLFDSQRERIIKSKLVRWRYVPKLPFGGKAEWKLAELCWRLGRDREFDYAPRARALGDAFKSVMKCYYKRQPTKFGEKERKALEHRKWEAETEAIRAGNWDRYTFYDELLKGFPKDVSDFNMDCRFVLVKGAYGEDRDRMVVLKNHLQTSGVIALDPKSFTAPRDFKLWVAKAGPFNWSTGEQELEMLREDINNLSAHNEVFEPDLVWLACASAALGGAGLCGDAGR